MVILRITQSCPWCSKFAPQFFPALCSHNKPYSTICQFQLQAAILESHLKLIMAIPTNIYHLEVPLSKDQPGSGIGAPQYIHYGQRKKILFTILFAILLVGINPESPN